MSRKASNEFWQSYGDLAMGLMAVFVFILILLLHEQETRTRKLEALSDAHALTISQLNKERAEFALEMLKLLESTWSIVERQDAAEEWLGAVFADGDCELSLSQDGVLRIASEAANDAELYVSGETALSEAGRRALSSCGDNFRMLANCLNPRADESPEEARACRRVRQGVSPEEEREGVRQFRSGIEALVLEGTTDRASFGIFGAGARTGAAEARNYIENARLGAERARQAMAYLLELVRDDFRDDYDALPVFMNKIRVETSSYGRFQAGPPEWRKGGCDVANDTCDEARRLSLGVRWKKEELRKPYEQVKSSMCQRLRNPKDPLTIGLRTANRNIIEILERYGCLTGEETCRGAAAGQAGPPGSSWWLDLPRPGP